MLKKLHKPEIQEPFIRIVVAVLIILGVINAFSIQLLLLVIAGVISGFYYGFNNDIIWDSKGKLKPYLSHPGYRGQQVWVHLICGIVGSLALYLFLNRVCLWFLNVNGLDWTDFILSIISVLGYTGLLARALWFYANRGGNMGDKG